MSVTHGRGKATARLGDNFQAACDGVKCSLASLKRFLGQSINERQANITLSRISKSARRVRSEGINRISFSAWPNESLQAATIRYVHTIGEQVGEILGDANILEHPDRRFRRQLYKYVDVATRLRFIPCGGAKQRRMQHPKMAQVWLVGTQRRNDMFTVHP